MFLLTLVLVIFDIGVEYCAASPIDKAVSKESRMRRFDSNTKVGLPKRNFQTAKWDVAFQFPRMTADCRSISPIKSLPLATDNIPDPEPTETNESLRQAIENVVSKIGGEPPATNTDRSPSVVHIIGTGLTPRLLDLPLSTLDILSQADAVLYDSLGLSYQDISRIVPEHCEVICVGKRGDKKSWKQTDIDELLLQMATTESTMMPSSDSNNRQPTRKTKSIVRLKGGDPFLFGRTRTEIEALRSNNVPYSYTPGISSCIAGPHLGGIPLTDPTMDCQSFGVWSGTDAFGRSWGLTDEDDASKEGKKWRTGLDVDVLVFLMIGRLDKLEALCRSIANNGGGLDDDYSRKWSKDTPCAVVQNAGGRTDTGAGESMLPMQRVWRSTLGDLVDDIRKEDQTRVSVSPAVFIAGATAALDLLAQDTSQL